MIKQKHLSIIVLLLVVLLFMTPFILIQEISGASNKHENTSVANEALPDEQLDTASDSDVVAAELVFVDDHGWWLEFVLVVLIGIFALVGLRRKRKDKTAIAGKIGLLILVVFSLTPLSANAENGHSITVVKYKLEGDTQLNTSLVLDGTKVDDVTDQAGRRLEKLPGIDYVVVRVDAQGVPLTGKESFSTQITTDAAGIARVEGLTKGTYTVFELENKLIQAVMEPMTVQLPLARANGESLHDIYLYPKSNIVAPEHDVVPEAPGNDVTPDKLPQTAGNIGSLSILLWLGFGIVLLGSVGIYVVKNKEV